MKNILKMLGGCGVVLAALSLFAETETVGDYTWTYRINGETAEIYNNYNAAISPKPNGAVTIPSTLGGKTVTSIGSEAFYGCSSLTSVTIGNSVTSIGSYAFSGCSSLASVTIGNGVTTIGYAAFRSCSGLVSFAVDDGDATYKSVNGLLLTKDGKTLVAGVNGDVVIPHSVTRIGDDAFYGRSGLTNMAIPDSVTSIGEVAFARCSGLTNVTIPNSVSSIGIAAFSGCTNLTDITIPYSVERIGAYAFDYCNALFDTNSIPGVVLVDGWAVGYNYDGFNVVTDEYGWGYVELDLSNVRGIAGSAFEGCYPQGYFNSDNSAWIEFRINLGESVGSIGERAFYGTSTAFNLSGICIGNIGEEAFYDCYVYSEGYSSGSNPNYDGFENVGTIDDGAFRGCYGLEDYDGFVVVKGVLHDYHPRVTGAIHVDIPDGVTRIGPYSLADLYRPDGYGYGYNITSVSIPDSVTSIAHDAFSLATSLESVAIGKGVSVIEEYAFPDNWCLSITVGDENPYYKVEDGALKTKDGSRIVYSFAPSFGDAVGMHGAWTTGGDAEWWTGEGCACSGGIGDGQESWLEIPVSGTGVISFRWKASSESYRDEIFDYATFSVDGVEVAMIGGETDWTNVTHFIAGGGSHIVRWTYKKDEDGTGGEDCVWLDDVQYARKVCVSFSGGDDAEGTPPEPLIADLGAKILLPGAGSLALTKHNFTGWQYGTAVWPAGAELVVGDEDIVLIAAWEAKRVTAPVISVAERFSGDSTIVTMTCVTQGASIYYTLDGTEPTTKSSLYEGPFAIAETVTISAFAVMDDWFDSETASARSIRIPDTLSGSLNSSGLAFRTDGDSEWEICLDEAHDGEASARSGDIEDGQTSWIETEVAGAGTVSFWWKVSSEASKKKIYDRLWFTVDGEPTPSVPDIGGETDWTNVICRIAASGNHILRWTYEKDEENDMGEDCAWLDNVVWTPDDPLPPIDVAATDDDVSAIVAGLSDVRLSDKIGSAAEYTAFRSWVDSNELSHSLVKDAPNAWLSYALDAPGLMARATPLASEDVVIDSIETSSSATGAFDLVVDIADAEIGEGTTSARLAEALGVEGAAELDESAFSSDGLTVNFSRTADGKAKATVMPDGAPPAFFLRVKVQ